MKLFRETEFVIFDVETTGLSPAYGDRMIEIAAVRLKGLKPVDTFHSLIDPRRDISYGAFLVNGISQEMLKGAPTAEQVLPEFMKFLGKACLVAHNIRFDLSFLTHELSLFGHPWPDDIPLLDTVRLARRLLPDLQRYRLLAVASWLGIEIEQTHRALADAELTATVFCKLLEAAFRQDVEDVAGLHALCGHRRGHTASRSRKRQLFP